MSTTPSAPPHPPVSQGNGEGKAVDGFSRSSFVPAVRQLSQINPWASAFWIAFQWAVIALAFWAAVASGHWAVYLLAAIVIGTRLQALGVLMHDGAHFLLFKNRTINDVVSDLFCAFPAGMSTTLFRHTHLQHHHHTNAESDPDLALLKQDPDFYWPRSRWAATWLMVRCLLSINVLRTFRVIRQWSPNLHLFDPLSPKFPLRARLLFVTFATGTTVAVLWADLVVPAVLLVLLPGVTYLNFSNRLRATAEHLRVPGSHELNSTRTVVTSWFGRFFLCPHGIGYHLEHHLFPSVPGRQLSRLHCLLMEDETYAAQARITRGYPALWKELTAPLEFAPAFPSNCDGLRPSPDPAPSSADGSVAAHPS